LTAKEILEEDKTLKTPKRLQLRESKIDTGQHLLSFGKKKGNKET
jgi:hypothetical protein